MLQRSLTQKETERFLEEAQTLVRLRHARIVRVLDFAVERGTPVLIMDYVPGGTLRQRHPAGTRLSVDMTVHYITQLASALQYAHNQHVIHRDVKPENMLLDAEEQLLLSDFGLALLAPSIELLSTQPVAGTPSYLAPEQVRGKPHFASDQYALGVLTYEWLTGKRPFQGNAWELYHQHLTVPPPPLRERCPELPAAVEQVVHKALAKDPQERYVSISAFAQALERASREGRSEDEDSQRTAPLRLRAPVLPSSRSNELVPRVVFLSAAPGDESAAVRLAADLKQRGVVLTSERADQETLQEKDLQAAIRAAEHVVIVVTPQTRSSRLVREHLRLAQMYQRRLVLVWMQGEEMAGLLLDPLWQPFLPMDVVDARSSRYQAALDELLACLREERHVVSSEETTTPTTPEELRDPRNPYKGLRAFRQADALDFFGRDGLLEGTIARLKSMLAQEQQGAPASRLLTLVGPSGSGKSSVVQAGLLPRLQAGVLPGSQNWVYLEPIVPGTHPLESLALMLAPRFPDRSMKALYEDLQDDSARGLHRLCAQLAKGPDCRVVLVVDQFEELFTQTLSEEERRSFVDLLVTAATEKAGPVLLLLTLRVDFYGHPMRYPHLYQLIEAHHQSILPMEIHDLRAMIEEPAALPDVQLTFEGNLVGDLLFEAQGQVGALPLLEFTLDQLFQQREGQTLTLAAYRRLGGVKGALVKHAEATYAALPSEEHRRLARALFLRLIEPGLSEQDTTRRRASLAELSLSDAKQTAILQEVADSFVAARLLTTNDVAGTTTIEVSHEALIRAWPRLAEWLREGREDIHLQQVVSRDVEEWERRGKPKDRLYRGSQLKEARAWARRNVPSSKEAVFLQTSSAYQTRSRVSIAALLLLLVLAVGLVVRFVQAQQPANLTRVTNRNDAGPGSLRQAINTAPAGSTITFDPDVQGTILLTSGNLNIGKSLTIKGPGAGTLAISSGSRGFFIQVDLGASVAISGLAFTHSTIGSGGSEITNRGKLTLFNSIVSDNTGNGGGIFNEGTLTLTNSTVSNNTAASSNASGGWGGGIYNYSGTLTLTNSTVSNNTAAGGTGNFSGGNGGGIANSAAGKLTLTNSTISNNTAGGGTGSTYTGGWGGGIYNGGGTLTLTSSTVSQNRALGRRVGDSDSKKGGVGSGGGGIYNSGSDDRSNSSNNYVYGVLTLTNSTISGNTAGSSGGGIINWGGQTEMTFCTVYGNTAANGGGLAIFDGYHNPNPNASNPTYQRVPSRVRMRNSIVAGDHAPTSPDIAGTITSTGYNLIQDVSGAIVSPSNWPPTDVSVDPSTNLEIDPQLSGKSPQTHALFPGSPAIDRIPPDACHPTIDGITITTDQRGVKRPQGARCDIGAYEYEATG